MVLLLLCLLSDSEQVRHSSVTSDLLGIGQEQSDILPFDIRGRAAAALFIFRVRRKQTDCERTSCIIKVVRASSSVPASDGIRPASDGIRGRRCYIDKLISNRQKIGAAAMRMRLSLF